jgi:predicted ATPase/class 3 adenylate cyclase
MTVPLPTGTVTFLFSDIEGSTRLLQELGDAYSAVQDDHARLMRAAIAEGGGVEIRTEGDSFFVVFPSAAGAVRATVTAQRSFAEHPWLHGKPLRVRMGLHTGEGRLGGDDYLGIDVNRAARIAASGHGGQVLLSEATRALVVDALPAGISIRNLGAHRLKDFDDPQPIHQLVIEGLEADFAPLKTLDTPTNLPIELTSFVGRQSELQQIEQLLGSARLVTLTGPGGSGKTRLALRAATKVMDRFPDGVFLVALDSVRDPALVPGVIAASVGTREVGPRPVMEALQIELRHRDTLLVLDNFEQVIEAAPSVVRLLMAAPKLRFLVTSRGALRIQGEHEFPVMPLELPDPEELNRPEDLNQHEATALFLERAMAIDPRFKLSEETARAVIEICRRLDGLPLAIELAASRLRLMSPIGMLERLDRALPMLSGGSRDLPDRQRTLRGAIGWGYDLLSENIAGVFRRACVFAGGFTLSAAEAVIDPSGDLGVDTLTGLDSLLDASLIFRRTGSDQSERFDTLQTIREYGLERLIDHGEDDPTRRRHARHFLQLAETVEPWFRGPDLLRAIGILHIEHDNVRAALDWAIDNDEGDTALRMVAALWRFWHLHGDLTAGRRWIDAALSLPSSRGPSTTRGWALLAAGSLAYWQLDPDKAAASYQQGLEMFTQLGDRAGIAEGIYHSAFGLALQLKVPESMALFRKSRETFESLGNRRGVADSLFGLCMATRLSGDAHAARAAGEEGLRIHRELRDMFGVYGSLYAVGRACADQGDLPAARTYFLEALGMAEAFGDRTGIALSLDLFAELEILKGNPMRALQLAGASQKLKDSIAGQAPPELVHLLDPRERARQALTDAELAGPWERGRAMTLDKALAMAKEET